MQVAKENVQDPCIICFQFPQAFLIKPPDRKAEEEMKTLLADLNKNPCLIADGYMTGDQVTIADFCTLTSLTFLEAIDYHLTQYENIARWISRCKELPYFEECNARFEKWKTFAKSDLWKEIQLKKQQQNK